MLAARQKHGYCATKHSTAPSLFLELDGGRVSDCVKARKPSLKSAQSQSPGHGKTEAAVFRSAVSDTTAAAQSGPSRYADGDGNLKHSFDRAGLLELPAESRHHWTESKLSAKQKQKCPGTPGVLVEAEPVTCPIGLPPERTGARDVLHVLRPSTYKSAAAWCAHL